MLMCEPNRCEGDGQNDDGNGSYCSVRHVRIANGCYDEGQSGDDKNHDPRQSPNQGSGYNAVDDIHDCASSSLGCTGLRVLGSVLHVRSSTCLLMLLAL